MFRPWMPDTDMEGPSSMTRILVIDTDREFCRLLGEYLIGEGMTAQFAHDGKLGVSSALSGRYDVVVLDAVSRKLSGFQAIKQLRASSGVGLLMLTTPGEEVDGILGLEYG